MAVVLTFQGPHQEFYQDDSSEICLSGALSSGKTTVALAKDLDHLLRHDGMHAYIGRFSDTDCRTKLKPAFEEVILDRGVTFKWNSTELCYEFTNGSKCYAFGLKSADAMSRYAKLRGLGVSRLTIDQAEELLSDIALELRARLRQRGFPHALTLVCNPPNVDHWIAKQFPIDGSIKGRKLYELSLYDNAHNLPVETIATLERAYPPEHAKHATVIMGKRGLNVTGEPVYGDAFVRAVHVRSIKYDPDLPLLEAFDAGQRHPYWLVAQQPYAGGLHFLGGILGQELFLEDFTPIVLKYRNEWFPDLKPKQVKTCCTMSTPLDNVRFTSIDILRKAGFKPVWNEKGNSPDVVLALIERIAGYMRRRAANRQECLGVNNDETMWLRASREGIEPSPLVSQAFEAGYTWDEKLISVGSNEFKRPRGDQWFEFSMRCAEAIELNFGASRMTGAERDSRRSKYHDGFSSNSNSPTSWLGS